MMSVHLYYAWIVRLRRSLQMGNVKVLLITRWSLTKIRLYDVSTPMLWYSEIPYGIYWEIYAHTYF